MTMHYTQRSCKIIRSQLIYNAKTFPNIIFRINDFSIARAINTMRSSLETKLSYFGAPAATPTKVASPTESRLDIVLL